MPRASSPTRYAQAVFQIALEKDRLDDWLNDLGVLRTALQDRDFSILLDSPQIQTANKIAFIAHVLDGAVDPMAINMLCILASRNLAHTVENILFEYGKMLDAHMGVARAEVVTAISLDAQQREKISALLSEIVGKEIKTSYTIDPAIIGGLIAKVGDRVMDCSTRTKLDTMRQTIVEKAS